MCVQVGLEMLNAPLLPPSNIRKSNDVAVLIGKSDIQFEDAASARDWYQVLRQRTLSRLRQRKFVYGAIYTDLFPGYFCVDPAKASYDLVVTLASGERSLVQVRRVAVDDEIDSIALLTSLVDLGGTLLKYCKGNCRGKKVGEIGMMYAMGVRSSRTNAFYSCKDVVIESVTISSTLMTAWMMKNMNNVLQEIKITVESMKVRRWPALTNGPGSRMVVSVNLGNSPHYDVGDTSSSVAVWVEEKPGTADNWYFILPNVSFVGSTGLAIKLGHGVAISWDGRDIYHCTSNTVTGNQNNVYGCLWGSCSRF